MSLFSRSMSPQAPRSGDILETPARSAGPAGSFLLKANKIRSWIRDLPLANIGETGDQVYKALAAFNRTELNSLVRSEAIELFREPVRYLSSNMATDYVESGFPMSSKAKKSCELSYELCMEMALSYKIIIKEQLAKKLRFNQKLVIVAVHRALQYLGQALLQSYLSYSDPRPGIWREIHFLYEWAVQNQVHNLPVKETAKQGWKEESQSIEDLYKSHILMSTISPHSLRHTQLCKIHGQLNNWSRLTKVVEQQNATRNSGVFFVNLHSDSPPHRLTNQAETKDSGLRVFDLSPLIAYLQSNFENASWESPASIETEDELLSRSLLKLLIDGWNKPPERRFARRSLKKSLNVVLGLNSLHYLVDQADLQDLTPATGAPRHNEDLEMNLETWKPTAINEVYSVPTDDESVGGYRLRWEHSIPPKVRVGDIIGIQANEPKGQYALCIVRWLKYLQDDKFYIGIEIIAPGCISAALVPSENMISDGKNHYRCLLLTARDVNSIPTGLICDTKEFEPDTVLTLVTNSGARQIMITDRLESNNRFIHYRFKYLEDAQPGD